MRSQTLYTGTALLIILVGFVLRVAQLDEFPPGVSNDEAVNVVDALHISQIWRFPFYEDFGRPEPLYRFVLALGQVLFGPGVWSARVVSAFIGVVTLACAYWAVQQLLYDQPLLVRSGAALFACGFLALALGHLTLSRALYRGILQPLTMFLGLGLALRALRTMQLGHFVQAGLWIGLGFYTYTAYVFVPLALIPLALALPLARRHNWPRAWWGLIVAGGVALLVITPIAIRFLQTPQAVVGRSGATASTAFDLGDSLRVLIDQIWNAGDENPQYNVAHAPIVAPIFLPLLVLGLVALIWRWKQPSIPMLAALLILTSLPALLSDEVNHGLRTVGLLAALTLVIGLGAALILKLLQRTLLQYMSVLLLWLGIPTLAVQSWQVYTSYWLRADDWPLWRVHNHELNHNEWFFRTDQRELAAWIAQQSEPLLLPVEALNQPTLRAWLARSHPPVTVEDTDFVAQPSRIILPYSLERASFLPAAPHYALLKGGRITILPPFDKSTEANLIQATENAEVISGTGRISPIARTVNASPELAYEKWQSLSINYERNLSLKAWSGENWQQDGVFSALWQAEAPLAHDYFTYLQILDQDYRVIAQAQDTQALRWLYPSTLWPVGQPVPVPYVVPSQTLEAGAYRLVIGAYPIFRQPLQAFWDGQALLFPQAAWLKVAHVPVDVPDDIPTVHEVFGQTIELIAADIRQENQSLLIDLYWRSLIHRPNLDATIFVHALDADGNIIAQQDARPQNGRYPTFIWDADEVVYTHHQLQTQSATRLRVGLYEFIDGVPRNLPANQGQALLLNFGLQR
ncbi:MAG: glycosyltransferase family 39 protein [Anaerolineae bacterium]|nr:glycosyltransferase family 39 protein [Anaerolineae bacterium]